MAVKKRDSVKELPVYTESELDQVKQALRKKLGDAAMLRATEVRQPYRIPTGIFIFDLLTLGGFAQGRFSLLDGVKHSGKTTLALRAAAGAQRSMPDQRVVWIDVERAFDTVWASKHRVDADRLELVQLTVGEEVVDVAEAVTRARDVSLVVVDSLAGMAPTKEIKDGAGDANVGLQAKLINTMMRKLTAAMSIESRRGHQPAIIMLNQQRVKIGGWSPTGEPLAPPGGKAPEFFSSLSVTLKNKENMAKIDGRDVLSVNEHAFTIKKNRMNGGGRTGEFRMMRRADPELGLNEGDIDDAGTMLVFAARNGWYTGGGRSWRLEYGEVSQQFGNRDEAVKYLYENADAYSDLRRNLIATEAQEQGMPDEFIEYLLTS